MLGSRWVPVGARWRRFGVSGDVGACAPWRELAGELQTRRRDGQVFWERVLFSPLKDQDGKVTNFVAIKENISAFREIVSRLQESGAASAQHLGDGRRPGSRIIYLGCSFRNPAAEELMGVSPGLLGKRPADIALERVRTDGTGVFVGRLSDGRVIARAA